MPEIFRTEHSRFDIKLKKFSQGEDVSLFGAFSADDIVTFSAVIPRALGVTAVRMRITTDEGDIGTRELSFTTLKNDNDIFTVTVNMREICRDHDNGLFFYDLVFFRKKDVPQLFSSSVDNIHMTLTEDESAARRFRLLVYRPGFSTPKWFKGSIMYHIFTDRFAKGSFSPPQRADAVMNDDWQNGIPQYAERRGAFVANNMFFGGNLIGVREKLDYLSSLGVGVIYLSPIFKAYSNHKYDTGDYMTVDEMFGGTEALEELIKAAEKKGIKIILDGVFNHTGDDSKYFNKYGKYPELGAYQSKDSPYYDWFSFSEFPNKYDSWWGIPILPKLRLDNKECRDYFTNGETSVVGKYTKMGIGGFRLDVADELTDEFLDCLTDTAKTISEGEAIIIGEVWENAADKISYGKRRRYLRGAQLDSVMNYPLKNAVIDLIMNGNSSALATELTEIYASYPKCVSDSLMNILGTHDTERILSVLSGDNKYDAPNDELAHYKMSAESRARAKARLKLASIIQYTVYGIPSIFYGDEAGVEGYHDPFCRVPFPWGREDADLIEHYRAIGRIRRENDVFSDGYFKILDAAGAYIAFERRKGDKRMIIGVNASDRACRPSLCGRDLITGASFDARDELAPMTAVILEAEEFEDDDPTDI